LLSYEEIGELMDLNRNAVAQLISRARIKLGDLLRGSALASVGPSSPECERALPLLALLQDAQEGAPGELDWVRTHLAGCETCRLSRAAMEEAGVSYRALGLLVPAAWLRHATIARAAEFVGADWSHVAGSGSASAGASGSASSGGALPDAAVESDPGLTPDKVASGTAPQALGRRGKLAASALLGFVLCVLLALVLAGNLGRDRTQLLPAASSSPVKTPVLAVKPHGREDKLTAPHGRVHARRLVGSSGRATALAVSTAPAHGPVLVAPAHQHRRRHHGSTPVRRAPAGKSPPAATPAPAPTTTTTTTSAQSAPPAPAPSTGSGSTTTETTTSSPGGSTGPEGTGTTPTNPNNPAGPPGLVP
jgi:hypothetical protein